MTELTTTDLQALENKLSAARTKLILDKPFLGALVLRLPLQIADSTWCVTTGTDARKFYYNPKYIDVLTPAETQFVLAHEALHCALSHFARREHRFKQRWDLACDYAINPILLAEGFQPPPGIKMLYQYKDMTAEEIYPCLSEKDDSEPLDEHLYDQKPKQSNPDDDNKDGQSKQQFDEKAGSGNNPPPPPLNQKEREELSIQWQQRMAGAAQQAMQAGKLSGVMQRLVEELLEPRLPWRALLAHYMTATARDDYQYARPSSRRGDPAIFPRLKSQQVHAVIALDVSGSINDKELNACLAEINAIKGQLRAKITLLACDMEIIDDFPLIFQPWQEITLPKKIAGGGGTDFNPIFNWADQQDQQPDILLYFTDAQGRFPKNRPNYPVIWLIKGRAKVPWGQRIQLN